MSVLGKGLWRKSNAPAFMARIVEAVSWCAVMITIGTSGASDLISGMSSRPLLSGSTMSTITSPGWDSLIRSRHSRALRAVTIR